MKNITFETICKKITDLQRDVKMIMKSLLDELGLREDFILRKEILIRKDQLRLMTLKRDTN